MGFISSLQHGIALAFGMAWDTWWALVFGFTFTGAVDEFVTEEQMREYLGDDGWREVGFGTGFGILSSSCSFSAIATAKTLFKKGASPVASVGAFQFAATDLVLELGLAMWVLLGWQFVAADFVGGVVAVLVLAIVYRRVPDDWWADAREHVHSLEDVQCEACGMDADPSDDDTTTLADGGKTLYFCCGGCEMVYENRQSASSDESSGSSEPAETSELPKPSKTSETNLTSKLTSVESWKRATTSTIKEWDMLWEDIALGFLIAGLIAGLVPRSWWTTLFSGDGGFLWVVTSTVIAVVVGVATFICSVGNVPFALVLWQNGIAFGAVLSFIFADLIIPPIVNSYRRYYGPRIAAVMFGAMFLASVVAGVVVHYFFGGLGLIPPQGQVGGTAPDSYTLVLNLLFTPVFLAQVYVAYGPDRVGEFLVALPGIVGGAYYDVRQALSHVASAGGVLAGAVAALGAAAWRAGGAFRRAAGHLVRALGLLGESLRSFGAALRRAGGHLREAFRKLR